MPNFTKNIKGDDTMAIKQSLIIEDEISKKKYFVGGQSGLYTNTGYKMDSDNYPILNESDNTERFLLVDLWQLGVFGSENCKSTYDAENEIHLIKEEDVYHYASACVKEITKGLEQAIAQAILEEIEEDGEETIKLIKE